MEHFAFPEVLDSTMLASMRCPRKFMLSHVRCLAKAGRNNIHLTAGGAYAKGLEMARKAYMDGQQPEECLEIGVQALIETYGDADPGTTAKSLDRMVGALEFYFSNYPLDDDPARIAILAGVPAVEWRFALPLPFKHPDTGQPLLYAGRTDMICNFCGALYAEDDKTTSSLGASWSNQWELRSQFMGYAWAGRELGLGLQGTLVRGVSILKTKYDTAQSIVSTPSWMIDEWVEHRDYLIANALKQYTAAEPYWEAAFDDTCNEYGGCQFKNLCGTQPDYRENLISTGFELNVWNPLDHN